MRKVCIIGTTPSSAEAPFDDPSWEIWGCSARGEHVTRATRWFELHSFKTEEPEWVEEWIEKLHEWTKDVELWVARSDRFIGADMDVHQIPIAHIKNTFGTYFLTSTVAWELALAIDEGVDEIAIYGVDLEHGEEYVDQRAGVKHFIELARFAGIKLDVPGFNGVAFDPVPYPMWQDDPLRQKVDWREKLLKKDLEELDEKKRSIEKGIYEIAAAHQVLVKLSNSHRGIDIEIKDMMNKLDKKAAELDAELPSISMQVANCMGQLRGTQWQRNLLKP